MAGRRDDASCMYSLLYSEKCPFTYEKWAVFAVEEAIHAPRIVTPPCHSQPWLYSYTALYSIHAIHHPSDGAPAGDGEDGSKADSGDVVDGGGGGAVEQHASRGSIFVGWRLAPMSSLGLKRTLQLLVCEGSDPEKIHGKIHLCLTDTSCTSHVTPTDVLLRADVARRHPVSPRAQLRGERLSPPRPYKSDTRTAG